MQSKTYDNKVNKTIESTLKNLSDIIDVDLLEKNPDKEAEQENKNYSDNGGNR